MSLSGPDETQILVLITVRIGRLQSHLAAAAEAAADLVTNSGANFKCTAVACRNFRFDF